MGLEIRKIGDVFYLDGNINASTVSMLKNHFNYTYDLGDNIILNLDQVRQIDSSGMRALEEIYLDSKDCHQRVCITGIKFYQLFNGDRAA